VTSTCINANHCILYWLNVYVSRVLQKDDGCQRRNVGEN